MPEALFPAVRYLMVGERTCIGCRVRDGRSRLLRVVIDPSSDLRVIPDRRSRLPGRGAWIHPNQECVENANRRRAFARALRVSGSVTITDVVAFVASCEADVRSSTTTVKHGSGKRLMDQR